MRYNYQKLQNGSDIRGIAMEGVAGETVNLGAEEEAAVLPLLRQLRGREIAAEIYPEAGKMKKQMEYANRRGIPYVVIVGSQELEAGAATVKDMRTGEQRQVSLDKLATEICNS